MYMIAPTPLTQIVIRYSGRDDKHALARLAGRDSQAVPQGEVLVAEADGEIRAAVSVDGKAVVADPFHPTAELVRLLEVRGRQLRSAASERGQEPRAAHGPRLRRSRLAPAAVGRLARR
jgi:hypothetical protein